MRTHDSVVLLLVRSRGREPHLRCLLRHLLLLIRRHDFGGTAEGDEKLTKGKAEARLHKKENRGSEILGTASQRRRAAGDDRERQRTRQTLTRE